MNVSEINKYNSVIFYVIILLLFLSLSLVMIPFIIFDPIENRLIIIVIFSTLFLVVVIFLLIIKKQTGVVKLEEDHIQLPYAIEQYSMLKQITRKNLEIKFLNIDEIEFRESRTFFHLKNGVKIRTASINIPDQLFKMEEIKSVKKVGKRKNPWVKSDYAFARFVLKIIKPTERNY